jgi:hypothetical protein
MTDDAPSASAREAERREAGARFGRVQVQEQRACPRRRTAGERLRGLHVDLAEVRAEVHACMFDTAFAQRARAGTGGFANAACGPHQPSDHDRSGPAERVTGCGPDGAGQQLVAECSQHLLTDPAN